MFFEQNIDFAYVLDNLQHFQRFDLFDLYDPILTFDHIEAAISGESHDRIHLNSLPKQ